MTAQLTMRGLTVLYDFDVASPRLAASGTGRFALTEAGEIEMTVRLTDTSLDPYVRVVHADVLALHHGDRRRHRAHRRRGLHARRAADRDGGRRPARAPVRLRAAQQRRDARRRRRPDRPRIDQFGSPATAPRSTCSGRSTSAPTWSRCAPTATPTWPCSRACCRTSAARAAPRSRRRSADDRHADGVGQRPPHRRTSPHRSPSRTPSRRSTASSPSTPRRCASTGCARASPTATCRFGGRLGLRGLALADYDVTLTGLDLRLRYPEGMRSLVDATLALQGPADDAGAERIGAGALGGRGRRRFDAHQRVRRRRAAPPAPPGPPSPAPSRAETATPLRYDVRLVAPSTFRIENDLARSSPAPTSTLRGTLRPAARLRPRRHRARRGQLRGPPLPHHARQPRLHQPRAHPAVLRHRGRDPGPGPGADLPGDAARRRHDRAAAAGVHLRPAVAAGRRACRCCSATPRRPATPSCASLRSPNQREQDLLQARATRALTGALSAEVGKVVQDTFGVDTFQITPLARRSLPAGRRPQRQPGRPRHHRQAHLGSHLPHLRAQPVVVDPRRDHPARVRPERHASPGCCRRTRTAPMPSTCESG